MTDSPFILLGTVSYLTNVGGMNDVQFGGFRFCVRRLGWWQSDHCVEFSRDHVTVCF